MCWEVENCDLAIRYRCPAFILRRPCWELWAVEGLGPARACCHNDTDCEPGRCAIAEKRFAGAPAAEPLAVHVGRRGAPLGFSRPRRHSCPNFFVTHGSGGRDPGRRAAPPALPGQAGRDGRPGAGSAAASISTAATSPTCA